MRGPGYVHVNRKKGMIDDLMTSYRSTPQLWPKLRGGLHTAFRNSAPSAPYHAQNHAPYLAPHLAHLAIQLDVQLQPHAAPRQYA